MAEGLRSLPAFQQTVPLYEKEPDDSVVCMEDKTLLWAVQWHPEFSFKTDAYTKMIFESFINAMG